MKPKWMPKYPYGWQQEIAYHSVKRLLEYLIANCGTIRPVEKKVITKNFLESMLKQLEAKQ